MILKRYNKSLQTDRHRAFAGVKLVIFGEYILNTKSV
jgi:hypothetical protein